MLVIWRCGKVNDLTEEDLNQALQIDSNYVDAYYVRGAIYSFLGNKQKALKDYRKAVELYQVQGKIIELQKIQNLIDSL